MFAAVCCHYVYPTYPFLNPLYHFILMYVHSIQLIVSFNPHISNGKLINHHPQNNNNGKQLTILQCNIPIVLIHIFHCQVSTNSNNIYYQPMTMISVIINCHYHYYYYLQYINTNRFSPIQYTYTPLLALLNQFVWLMIIHSFIPSLQTRRWPYHGYSSSLRKLLSFATRTRFSETDIFQIDIWNPYHIIITINTIYT